jgi:hypothetical protein
VGVHPRRQTLLLLKVKGGNMIGPVGWDRSWFLLSGKETVFLKSDGVDRSPFIMFAVRTRNPLHPRYPRDEFACMKLVQLVQLVQLGVV